MVKYEYCINAISGYGGNRICLRKGIENKEEAQQVLAQIVKHVGTRKTRYVSLGDIVFDPSYVMAYEIHEWVMLEDRSDDDVVCDGQDDGRDIVTVIDMDGAETTETVEDAPLEGVEEALF